MNQTSETKATEQGDRPQTAGEAAFAQQVLDAEAGAIRNLRITEAFHAAVELILERTSDAGGGSVVVGGLGKSGLIGQKLSATLSSTGTPSHFLHPAEAMHGDLGRLRRQDVALLLSQTGGTEEVLSLAAILKQDSVPVVAITGKATGELAKLATVALLTGDITEACPLNLAPTASTAAMLALGDALALSVSRRRAFSVDDFKKRHPGGSLGRQLMPVSQAMRFVVGSNLPLATPGQSVEEAFAACERVAGDANLRRPGALVVVDEAKKLVGVFTDGDLRRLLIRAGGEGMRLPLGEVMTRSPRRLTSDALVRDAVQLVRSHRINEIPVVDADGCAVGLIDVQDLMALKVIEG